MFRKLALATLTAAALIAGVLVYRQYAASPPSNAAPAAGTASPRAMATADSGKIGGVNVGVIENPIWYSVDPQTGRRKAVYRALSARQVGDEMFLTNPRIELLPESGQTVLITAEKAKLLADLTGGKFVPRRASMEGTVRVALMRPPDADGRQDTESFVRAELEGLELDLQRQEMDAPGPVAIYGSGMAIKSNDLTISWNLIEGPTPWALRRLRLSGGGQIFLNSSALKPARDRAAGPTSRSSASAVTTGAAEPFYDLVLHDQLQITGPRGWLKDAESLEAWFSYRPPRDMAAGNTAGGAASGGTTTSAASAPLAPATMPTGPDVTVIQWAGALEMAPADPNRAISTLREARVVAQAAAGGRMSLGTLKEAAREPAPSDGQAVAPAVEMSARCDRFEAQGDAAHLSAVGQAPVEVVTGDGLTIVGRDLQFNDAAGQGPETAGKAWIDGKGTLRAGQPLAAVAASPAAAPASAPADENAESPTITWDDRLVVDYQVQTDPSGRKHRLPAVAVVDGNAIFRAREGAMSADHIRVPFDATGGPGKLHLSTRQPVEATENARLTGNLAQSFPQRQGAPGGQGELTGGKIDIYLRPADAAERKLRHTPYMPTMVTAKSRITLTQSSANPEDDLRAEGDELISDLEAGRHDLMGAPGVPASIMQGSSHMIADKLVLNTDPNGQLLRVDAPCPGMAFMKVTEDLNGRALPAPRPALVRWGQKMVFLPAERASVLAAGPGALPTNEDDPIQDRITLTGDVAFDSIDGLTWPLAAGQLPADTGPGDHLRCQQLKLTFTPGPIPGAIPPPAAVAAVRPAAMTAAGPGGAAATTSSASPAMPFGRRSAQFVHATTGVRLATQLDDGEGYLLRRLTVRSQDIRLLRRTGDLLAQGKGDMIVEDYRPAPPPSPLRQAAQVQRDPMMPQQSERPSQVVFHWSRQMHLSRPDGQVWVAEMDPNDPHLGIGAVTVRWASGKRMAELDRLHIRRDAPIPPGHLTELDCGYLVARFQSNPNKAAAPAATGGGLEDLGLTIDRFDAYHGVLFKNTSDTTLEAYGSHLIYVGEVNQLEMDGSLDGSDLYPASVFFKEANGQPVDIPPYPRLIISTIKGHLDVQFKPKAAAPTR